MIQTTHRIQKLSLRILSVCLLASMGMGAGRKPLPTVPGPESTALASKAAGIIITEQHSDHGLTELALFHLPSLKKITLTPMTDGSAQIITGVSGPDENGRIAYIHATVGKHYYLMGKHYLKTMNIDGTKDQIVFQHPGGFSDTGIGDLVLAPQGGLIAFLNKGRMHTHFQNGVQMKNPPVYLTLGTLEIWDVNRKNALEIPAIKAVSTWSSPPFLSWFPDGKKLAYVELVPKEQATLSHVDLDEFVKAFPGWDRVPVITVLDLATGKKEVIHSGLAPVVSFDEKEILVQYTNQWMMLVDVANKEARRVNLPGTYSFAVAIPKHNLLLYWGFPTEGAASAYSPYGSFKAGMQMVNLKLADLETGRFQTVVYPIDPRHSVSFGALTAQK